MLYCGSTKGRENVSFIFPMGSVYMIIAIYSHCIRDSKEAQD